MGLCWGMETRFQNPILQHNSDSDSRPPFAQFRFVEESGERMVVSSSLGQDLRNARQGKGLELSQISSRLKISKGYLRAIEESDLNMLPPGNAYLVGYARSYASYLGLNTTLCVEKLKLEIAEREAKHRVPVSKKQIQEPILASAVRHTLSFLGLRGYEI